MPSVFERGGAELAHSPRIVPDPDNAMYVTYPSFVSGNVEFRINTVSSRMHVEWASCQRYPICNRNVHSPERA